MPGCPENNDSKLVLQNARLLPTCTCTTQGVLPRWSPIPERRTHGFQFGTFTVTPIGSTAISTYDTLKQKSMSCVVARLCIYNNNNNNNKDFNLLSKKRKLLLSFFNCCYFELHFINVFFCYSYYFFVNH